MNCILRKIFAVGIVSVEILLLASCASQPKTEKLESPQPLPLALDSRYKIRKIKYFLNDPRYDRPNNSEPAKFERSYYRWGAVDELEARQKRGHYYDIFWQSKEKANVTVRLEYKQLKTGNSVTAQQASYPNAKGTYRTHFQVIGDDYEDYGRVIAWRVILIVNDQIADFRQSMLW
ncbi:MAG: hypothetical protein N2035_01775 [Chthoniobacterales bacterium]|nr:hypothetical protein [Chthoniobacterales bacterium]